jgi:hypothetical protein
MGRQLSVTCETDRPLFSLKRTDVTDPSTDWSWPILEIGICQLPARSGRSCCRDALAAKCLDLRRSHVRGMA